MSREVKTLRLMCLINLVNVLQSDDIIQHNAEPETGSNGNIDGSVMYQH